MKKYLFLGLPIILAAIFVLGIFPTMAAKPQKAIEMSNGMPSGDHETLLIHGKQDHYPCEECVICETCDPPVLECNVINMPEYGTATIKYVSGKKVKIEDLTVFDSCAGWTGGDPPVDDPAEVWLPYEQQGYWVFARALGKPGKGDDERYIIFTNDSLEAYTLLEDAYSPGGIVIGLGLLTNQGTWIKDASGELYRFDGDSDKGKGKSQGKDITGMFMFSGFVFDPILDITGDGTVDGLDVIADTCSGDLNDDGVIDAGEIAAWEATHDDPDNINGDSVVDLLDVMKDTCFPVYDNILIDGVISYDGVFDENFPNSEFEWWLFDNIGDPADPLWQYYENEWIFTIADLVYLNQVVTNQGIKNLKIRFYPKATTTFTPVPPVVEQ